MSLFTSNAHIAHLVTEPWAEDEARIPKRAIELILALAHERNELKAKLKLHEPIDKTLRVS